MSLEASSRAETETFRLRRRAPRPVPLVAFLVLASAAASAQESLAQVDVKKLSLEDLGKIEITSVSKQAEPLNDAPAAIYVITNEDIRRSGARSLPEMLRLAPNLQVAQVNAASYAITARGFNSSSSNKLLVLIDGRSIYTPLFSGVFWDEKNVVPEDVDRIEVISGPGGTLWGANAVNGVINIVTRSAKETQGGLVFGGAGDARQEGLSRWGGQAGAGGAYRVYGKGFHNSNTVRENRTDVRDGWDFAQGGFRMDWAKEADAFTVQGDVYQGFEPTATVDGTISGHNLLARWNRQFTGGSALQMQLYYDQNARDVPGGQADKVEILDLDIQHSFTPMAGHHIVWGGGYRHSHDEFRNTPALFFVPANRDLENTNVYIQDEIALADRLKLAVGVRLEDNTYTGLSPLPSARLSWKVNDTNLLWAAVSRALRTPARLDRELWQAQGSTVVLAGGPRFEDEKLLAYEIGYRAQPLPRLSFSLSTYYNDYDDLRSIELSPTGGLPLTIGNTMEGETYGVEMWGTYTVRDWWRLSAGANLQEQDLRFKTGSRDLGGIQGAGNDPQHQFMVRSAMNLTDAVQLDLGVRQVGSLPNPAVPGYVAVDARVGWQISDNAELSVTGTNLLDQRHPEFGAYAARSVVSRAVFVGFRGRF